MVKALAFLLVGLVLLVFFAAVQLLLAGIKTSSVRLWLKRHYLKKRKEFSMEQLMEEAYIPPDVLSGERLLNMGCLPGILAGIIMVIGAQSDTLALVYIGGGLFLFFFIPFIVFMGSSSNPGLQDKKRKEFAVRRANCLAKLDAAIAAGAGDDTIVATYRRFWRANFNTDKLEEQKADKQMIDEVLLAGVKDDLQTSYKNSSSDNFLRSNILGLKKQIEKLQRKK
ncbi:MAG: hypothetical protein ABII93_03700 [Chrysiogenia bacterium]